jgi:hypothetical protein
MNPAIVGGTVFAGRSDPATVAVGAEAALADPPAFEAVTTARTIVPTSALVRV